MRRLQNSHLVLLSAFTLATAMLLCRHEMWRDELQAWLLARDTGDLSTFLHAMRYEGTPPLWHFLLRPLTALGHPAAMQALHGLIGLCSVYVIARFAPFSTATKTLLAFSYYFFYQYTVIARHYALGVCCLLIACALFRNRMKYPLRWGVCLAAAALTSVPALIVATGLAAASLADDDSPATRRSAAVFLVSTALAVYWMLPAPDAIFPSAHGWFFEFRWARFAAVLELLAKAFFPTPMPVMHFWENPLITHLPYFKIIGPLLGVGLFGWGAWLCRGDRAARTLYAVGGAGLLAFFYCKYLGYSRHHGFLFLNVILGIWLSRSAVSGRLIAPRPSLTLLVILALQCAGTVIAGVQDWNRPFSQGKAVAEYVHQAGLDTYLIAAGPDYAGVPVAGYRQADFYSAQGDRRQTFTRWDRRRIEMFDDREFIRRARATAAAARQPLLMLINYPMDERIREETGAELLRAFDGAILPDENYYLYRIK